MGVWHLILNGERFRQLKAAELQLGPSDIVALGHLYQGGPMTPRDLADTLDMTFRHRHGIAGPGGKCRFLLSAAPIQGTAATCPCGTPRRPARRRMSALREFDGAIRHAMAGASDTAAGGIGSFLQLLGDALETAIRKETPTRQTRTPRKKPRPG